MWVWTDCKNLWSTLYELVKHLLISMVEELLAAKGSSQKSLLLQEQDGEHNHARTNKENHQGRVKFALVE